MYKEGENMDRVQKKNLILALVCSAAAIAFSVVYVLHKIKFLDNFLVLVYILFFVGMAFMFTGGYQKYGKNPGFAKLFHFLGIVCMLASLVFTIWGLVRGWIEIWPF